MTTQSSLQINLADHAADADLERCLPFLAPIARRWIQTCQSKNPNVITLIAYVALKGAPTNYLCYASDARKLSRALDRPHSTIELRDYSLPIFYIAKTEIGMYGDQLSRMGIELVII